MHKSETEVICISYPGFLAAYGECATGALGCNSSNCCDVQVGSAIINTIYIYILYIYIHTHSGIGDSTLTWFQSYVSDRSQFVSISDSTSLPLPVTCGVPQGSILGPLLFTIFINDLPNVCKASTVHMYADDTVIYTSKPNLPQLEAVLQEQFTGVEKWIANNKLFLNTDKTVTMLFGTAPKLHKLQTPHLCVGTKSNGTLTTVTSLKYLGMWLDPNLSFGPHIEKLSSKLYPKLGALYRNKSCLSPAVRKQIVQQMLMPAIEYGDVVYAAAPQTHLQKL
uniref:Reverse transcriptase domain-containing protein n=1 Tax=Leptobrachium leishanense TaxID=445787 RepID=A0A8C5MVN6_9ANUR